MNTQESKLSIAQQMIDEFMRNWEFARSLTTDFIKGTPESAWMHSPGLPYAPLCRQFRHMVWVSGLYNASIADGKMDFSKKKSSYDGNLERAAILEGLKQKDTELRRILESKLDHFFEHKIKAFGSEMGICEFAHVILQHEATHHGLWMLYARSANFDTPQSWKDTWGLKSQ